jgi:HK97 gp10 family phage protein
MSEDVTVELTGWAELEERLSNLPAKLAKRVVRPALEEAGQIIQQEMGVRAPRHTGFLTTHIVYETTISAAEDMGEVKIGPAKEAFWGRFMELGAPGANVPAQPFMRPALEAKGDVAMKAMENEIRRGLEEVGG